MSEATVAMADNERLRVLTPVEMSATSCACPGRSRLLPMLFATVLEGERQENVRFHWSGDRWVACHIDEPEYEILFEVQTDLGVDPPPPTYPEMVALAEAAAAIVSTLDEDWQQMYTDVLLEAERGWTSQLARRLQQHADATRQLQETACRLAVLRVSDPQLAELAHRLLDDGFVGEPAALLATALAVLD